MTAEDIFLAAVEKPTPERAAYLAAACGADARLRAEAEALLRSHEEAGRLLDEPLFQPGPTVDQPTPAERAGGAVGPYKLVEMIGEGGMGAVWLAQQTEPVRRAVAVKLIKPGLDSRAVLARFEAERQALALMDHPNIAKVLDAGMTDNGRPYFVMELVKGVPITRYCDDRRLTPRQRLELFVPVCQAVQHAHQKGVIHRDIKPSNVLVALYDEMPVPKVIDFGIAKAAGQALTEKTLLTGFGAVVGTPEYMSPEQASLNNLDIDTRADVYSLGALLYELLVGTPPFSKADLEKAGLVEMLRVVREEDPPRPSTKLSTANALPTLASNRNTEPRKLAGLLRNDLDWIVMRALEKDRRRRYETASAFALDVQRYLAEEPVFAGPPAAGYRLRKFVKRNRARVAVAAVVFLTLILGVIGTTVGLVWALNAERQASRDRDTAWRERNAATAARDAEAEAKRIAQAENSTARRHLYAAHLSLAHAAWRDGEVPKVLELLDRQRPQDPDAPDLRGPEWHYLYRLCNDDLRTVAAHHGAVHELVFSPDGRRVASAGGDGLVKLWDVATGQEVQSFRGHAGAVECVRFAAGGERITTLGTDRTVRTWDAVTGREVSSTRLPVIESDLWVLSPDGRRVATTNRRVVGSDDDWKVLIWDVGTGRTLHELPSPRTIEGVNFSPNGRQLAVVHDQEGSTLVWDVETGRLARKLLTPGGTGAGSDRVYFSPDLRRVLCCRRMNAVTWFDAATGRLIHDVRIDGWPYCGAVSPDNRLFAVARRGYAVEVIDLASGRVVGTVRGHRRDVRALAYSPDGRLLASGDGGGTVKFWDRTDTERLNRVKPEPDGKFSRLPYSTSPDQISFVPGGSTFFTANRQVTSYDLDTAQEIATLPGEFQVTGSADGRHAVTRGREEQVVNLIDVPTRQIIKKFFMKPDGDRWPLDRASTMQFSPDGTRIAVADDCDSSIVLWAVPGGEQLATLRGHSEPITCLLFSPDGRRLYSSSYDKTVRVWDMTTLQPESTLSLASACNAIALHPDGRLISAACGDRTVRTLDLTTGKEVGVFRGHTTAVRVVAYMDRGRRLVTGAELQTVKLWDPDTFQELTTISYGGSSGMCMAVTPDGRILAGRHDIHVIDCRPLSQTLRDEREARGLLHWLFHKPLPKAEVIEAVRRDGTVSEAVRRLALLMVEHYRDRPQPFNDAAWEVVYQPDATRDAYDRALGYAATAHRLAPADGEFTATLAVAQYRAGHFQMALDTLAAMGPKVRQEFPELAAVEAMAAYRLGRRESARGQVAAFRKQFDRWGSVATDVQDVSRHFLVEAEALVNPIPAGEAAPPPREVRP